MLGLINNLSAASGESIIAIPADGSNEPSTKTFTVTPVAGFVTLTLSPGKYPTVLANKPRGKIPSSATTALPSKDGLDVAKRENVIKTSSNICMIRFIF